MEENEFSAEKPPEVGEIVQANEKIPHWFRCLIVVDEIKPWGIQGYATIPTREGNGDAFVRLQWDEILKTGGQNRFIVKEAENGETNGARGSDRPPGESA